MASKESFLVINSMTKWHKMSSSQDGIQFTDDGIQIVSYNTAVPFSLTEFSLPDGIVDLCADNCGYLYILVVNSNEHKSYIMEVNPSSGMYDKKHNVFSNPQAIENTATALYVLDENKIKIISKLYNLEKTIECRFDNPVDIVSSDDDTIFVLEKDKQIYKIENDELQSILDVLAIKKIEENGAQRFSIGKHDNMIYVSGKKGKDVLAFTQDGKYAGSAKTHSKKEVVSIDAYDKKNILVVFQDNTAYSLSLTDKTSKEFLKNTEFQNLSVDRNGMLYLLDSEKNKITQFQYVKRYLPSATYVTKPLDSVKMRTMWHRLFFDVQIPDGVMFEVFYFASDSATAMTSDEIKWKKTGTNPVDCLLDLQKGGRYLWLKLVLSNLDGKNTPRIKSLQAFFPRDSYLRYMPATYKTDDSSTKFLEQFLSIFETINSKTDNKIASFTKYLDPKAAPSESLLWLAGLLGIRLDETWSNDKARNLLIHLPLLHQMRGTRAGLEKILLLYLEDKTNLENAKFEKEKPLHNDDIYDKASRSFFTNNKFLIVENFEINCAMQTLVWQDYNRLFGNNSYSFYLLINSVTVDQSMINGIKKILASEIPAHTLANVSLVESLFQLGLHTYLGVNTFLNEYPLTVGSSMLGRDSRLKEGDRR